MRIKGGVLADFAYQFHIFINISEERTKENDNNNNNEDNY